MEKRRKKGHTGHGFVASCIWGIMAGILTGTVFIFALAAFAYQSTNPTALLIPLGLVSLGISALLTGRVACAVWGHGSMIPALVSGGVFSLMICLIGLCFPGSTLTLWIRIAGCPAVFLLTLLGGAFRLKKKSKRRRARSR